jgi:hypothetical protein
MGAQKTISTDMKYSDLSIKDKRDIINRVQAENGLNRQIIEKDWWVTAVLRLVLPSIRRTYLVQGWNQFKQMLAFDKPNV